MKLRRMLALVVAVLPRAAPAGIDDACMAFSPAAALAEVNALRSLGGRCGERGTFAAEAALRWSPALETVARRQAEWLAGQDGLVHTGAQGQTLGQRATEAGYRFARVTENLGQGPADPPAALAAWQGSGDHCANLFDAAVSEMALACRPGADGRPLWVLVLGRPR